MAREIKFRGKSIFTREWVYGDLLHYEDGRVEIVVNQNNIRSFNFSVIPETVGQSTNKFNQNGIEIFEGDILNRADKDYLCKVTWNEDSCGFNLDYWIWDESYDFTEFWDDFEVIGNITDNPELLEVE